MTLDIINTAGYFIANLQNTAYHFTCMIEDAVLLFYGIHSYSVFTSEDETGIGCLSAAFCIERSSVQNHLNLVPFGSSISQTAGNNQRGDFAGRLKFIVAGKYGLFHVQFEVRILPCFIFSNLTSGSGHVLLLLHIGLEAFRVSCKAVFCQNFFGQFQRKSISVIQLKGLFAVQNSLTSSLQLVHIFFNDCFALVDGLGKIVFFHSDGSLDEFFLFYQFRICTAGYFDDAVRQFYQELAVNTQVSAMSCSSSDQSSQNVASAFVGWHDTVADHEYHGTQVVSDNSDGYVSWSGTILIFHTGLFNHTIQNVSDCIDIEDGIHALHDACQSFQTHTGVDVWMFQITVGTVFFLGILSKYVVPEFQVTVAVTARLAVRLAAAVFRTSVEVNFGTWTARTQTDFPEVVFLTQSYDSIFRQTQFLPDFHSLVVILVYGCPNLIHRHLQIVTDEFQAPFQGLFLEIVPKGEAAQHFEESTVSGCDTYVIYVAGTDALLTGCHSLCRRCFYPSKIVLQRCHTGVDDQ